MPLWSLVVLAAVAGSVSLGLAAFFALRRLARREPYRSFIQLRTRRKLTFVRLMMRDTRVPLYVKAIPVLLLLYLSSPIDLVPDFIPVVGYLDDVLVVLLALVLIVKLTSRAVLQDLIQQAKAADAAP
jgi:uncharacterized membrane protein YkvA (DUF1232 family)